MECTHKFWHIDRDKQLGYVVCDTCGEVVSMGTAARASAEYMQKVLRLQLFIAGCVAGWVIGAAIFA